MFWSNKLAQIKSLPKLSAIRQAALLTTIFLIILLLAGATGAWLFYKNILENTDIELRNRHQTLSAQILNTNTPITALPSSGLLFASLQTPDGRIYGPKHKKMFKYAGFQSLEIIHSGEEDTWRIYSATAGENKLAMAINMEPKYEVLEHGSELFLIMGILTTVLTLLTALCIGLRAQQRLNHIHTTLDKVAEGDLSARISPAHSSDDLAQVATRIDETNARLERLLRQSRDLGANIAHDLKTPLARLRAKLETALDHSDPVQVNQYIEGALEQSDQMIATFEAILRLAHLNSGQYRQRFSALSLADIVRETAEIYQAVVEDSEHFFSLKIDSSIQIKGDRELIIQLIANLLENAIRHTPTGSCIILSCIGRTLTVCDNGPGIPIQHREQVLEPMYRLEKSRNTTGNGLGLSLVQSVAQLHKAQLSLSNANADANNPGLSVSLKFTNM